MNLTSDQLKSPYHNLRQMAFNLPTEKIVSSDLPEKNKAYGIIMDWESSEGLATMPAFETGDVSMYLSTGGGIIGGGNYERVQNAVQEYIKLGHQFLPIAKGTNATPTPENGNVRFYFLTQNGIYFLEESLQNLKNEDSKLSSLYEEAMKVLNELKKTFEYELVN